VSFIPVIDGKVHHFGACGLANGLAILTDKETWSYWDHITGEAFAGSKKGHKLEVGPLQITTVEAVMAEDPETPIFISRYRSLAFRIFQRVTKGGFIQSKGFIPPPFFSTMHQEVDPRLPKLEQGLGIMLENGEAKYYPMRTIPKQGSIEDEWGGGILVLARGEIDRVPYATWKASGQRPMQMLSRWYGFSFTYPKCEVYQSKED